MKIKRLSARVILNSKGEKTIEVNVNGYSASAPSGTSKGKHEARDFPSYGVPVNAVNKTVAKKLIGVRADEFKDLENIEAILKEYGFKKLGANTIVAIEFALLKAMSNNEIWKFLNPSVDIMPKLIGNCVGGGVHYKGESTDFQEFLVIPETSKVRDAEFISRKIYTKMGEVLKAKEKTYEGAWVTQKGNEEVLRILGKVTKNTEKKFGIDISLGVDIAASSLFQNNLYHYRHKMLSKEEQIKFINDIISKYNLKYVEDPVMEEDFEGFGDISAELVCADDLVCTNLKRLESAREYISAVIIKPNQAGSLIETKKVVDFAKNNGIVTIISHRSGETADATIADLAVAWEIPYIKCGIAGKERVIKLNRLKNIEVQIK